MLALLIPLLAIQTSTSPMPTVAVDPSKASGTCSCGAPALSSQLFGFVTTNTVLTYAPPGPIYDVLGDLVVNPSVTLTIQPGVTLRFASNQDILAGGQFPGLAELDVRGSLTADASAGDSIRFIASQEGELLWGQVRAEADATLIVVKAAFRGAVNALNLLGGGAKTATNLSISGSAYAISAQDATSLYLSDVEASNCTYGIYAPNATGTIRRCHISGRGTQDGIGLYVGHQVDVAAPDSSLVEPTEVANFQYGARLASGASVRNILARDCWRGIAVEGPATINYCTAVRNINDGIGVFSGVLAINSIAAFNLYGFSLCNGQVDYADSWSNSTNFLDQACGPSLVGPQTASFNPFFVDPATNDFRLADNSIFKNFSNSGGEIGAYGPGACPTVSASDHESAPAVMTASPNPTRGRAVLRFDQAHDGQVSVEVLDLAGRRVRKLLGSYVPAGTQRVQWDGKDAQGADAPAGLYFWRVTSGEQKQLGRVVIAR